jgi:hypothetical protein
VAGPVHLAPPARRALRRAVRAVVEIGPLISEIPTEEHAVHVVDVRPLDDRCLAAGSAPHADLRRETGYLACCHRGPKLGDAFAPRHWMTRSCRVARAT